MPRPEPTEIRITERGDETHESWILVRASRISSNPGSRLFGSEIAHAHFVRVTISRCTRQRNLQRDWLHGNKTLLEFDLSFAQWGAFVSSFGDGSGEPATLAYLDVPEDYPQGMIPEPANETSRLGMSVAETKTAADRAFEEVKAAHAAVQEAFDRNAGKKEMRGLLRHLEIRMENAPKNVAFAAKSLNEHVENVVTKAKADIEAMAIAAAQSAERGLGAGDANVIEALPSGDHDVAGD